MTTEYKTLREHNVQPGDVVMTEHTTDRVEWVGPRTVRMERSGYWDLDEGFWCIVSRASDTPKPYTPGERQAIAERPVASDTPKLWGAMAPEEKGALLLARHERKVIEIWDGTEWQKTEPNWHKYCAYRVRPEPKRETVTRYYQANGVSDSHLITFDLIDGDPDCSSIRMEAL